MSGILLLVLILNVSQLILVTGIQNVILLDRICLKMTAMEHLRHSMYYWQEKDSEYLRMAFNTKWPIFKSADELIKVDFDKFYDWQYNPNKDFYQFPADKANDMGIQEYEFRKHYL